MGSDHKEFEYTQRRLRSAKDVFNNGGHVTEVLRDQIIRLHYDNRRLVVEPDNFEGFDLSNNLFDSRAINSIDECSRIRVMTKLTSKKPYLRSTPSSGVNRSVYRTYLEVGVRNFIKGYLSREPCFGLRGTEFKGYRHLIEFIRGFYPTNEVKVSKSSVSHLKSRSLILRPVPLTAQNVEFVKYIRSKIPYFDEDSFLKYS